MSSAAFSVVDLFEERLAAYAGAKYGVAVASCTDALFLSCVYRKARHVLFPAHTYISAVAAAVHAGASVAFKDYAWSGSYVLAPYDIHDSAGRLTSGLYQGGLHCVSFHARKILPIGRGGMVLTDDKDAADWLRIARLDGRHADVPFMQDDVSVLGWNCYMTPEQAARGLQLLEALPQHNRDRFSSEDYPDLRKMTVFKNMQREAA